MAEMVLHELRAGGCKADRVPVVGLAERGDAVDAERARPEADDLVEPVGERPRPSRLQHPEPARTGDRGDELGRRDAPAHRGQLYRNGAADHVGERRGEHRARSKYRAFSTVGAGQMETLTGEVAIQASVQTKTTSPIVSIATLSRRDGSLVLMPAKKSAAANITTPST